MKLFILSLATLFGVVGLFDTRKYDHLDFNNDKFDITWDDITDDLWP